MKNISKIIPDRARFEFLTGFEGTRIVGAAADVLETTLHTSCYAEDLEFLSNDGIRTFRACIPWHTIERVRGTYDWSWVDAYLTKARSLGLKVIADPLHHTSFPEWLEGGFADPQLTS